jgi:hypothetical protein
VRAGTSILLIAMLAGFACGPPRVPVPPIIDDDFTLSGVPLDADSTEIRITFGDPDSIVSIGNPANPSLPIVEWYFDGFRVQFIESEVPNGFLITERTEATARGVRVGDPAFFVKNLYGDRTGGDESTWRYNDPGDLTARHVVDFLIETDTVRRIFIGWLVE